MLYFFSPALHTPQSSSDLGSLSTRNSQISHISFKSTILLLTHPCFGTQLKLAADDGLIFTVDAKVELRHMSNEFFFQAPVHASDGLQVRRTAKPEQCQGGERPATIGGVEFGAPVFRKNTHRVGQRNECAINQEMPSAPIFSPRATHGCSFKIVSSVDLDFA